MKSCITRGVAFSTLLLAGCATAPHTTKWEYKVVSLPEGILHAAPQQAWKEQEQAFLNDFGKEGWILVSQDSGRLFYFKRPIR
ncbi:MAG TPA: DUF4177 domain-containing protein [Verrucomicrobiae bacterium]|nr:DUF4177 domain-containing protein [Verrucomicrobiae bacterium]